MGLSYEGIVQKMIVLSQEFDMYHNKKEQFPIQEKEVEKIVNNSERTMQGYIKDLCNLHKMEEFLKFAYELRK